MRILLKVLRIPVDGALFHRVMSIALPFLFVMLAIKLVKLPAARSQGIFEQDLLPFAGSMLEEAIVQYNVLPFLGAVILAALIARLAKPRRRALALALAVPVLYALLALRGARQNLPLPLSVEWFEACLAELQVFGGLFWRELVAFLAIAFTAAWSGYLQAQRYSRVRSVAMMLLSSLLALVLAIDAGYFAATRTEISSDEFLYLLSAPMDALTAASDGWSREVGLLFALPLVALGVIYLLRDRVRARATPPGLAHRSMGHYLWPALLLAIAAPSVAFDQRMDRFSGNVLFRLGDEVVGRPMRELLAGPAAVAASTARVPTIDTRPIVVRKAAEARPLNVVLILLESIRADATTIYTPGLSTTPFLAELARESLVVDHMYANVPRTSAAWIASVTGRYPPTVSALRRWGKQPSASTFDSSLARQLRRLGYTTAFFTPTRLDFENDTALVQALGFEQVVSREVLDIGNYQAINNFGAEDRALLPSLGRWFDAQVDSRRSFFLTVMTNVGHYPYKVPFSWTRRSFADESPLNGYYLNSVAYMDSFVRDVVDQLRDRQLLDNTVLIVMGDHGEAFNEHGLIWHTSVVYEEGLHIPALIRLPGALHRTGRIGGLRQQIDLLPTVVDVLQLEKSGGAVPGKSLLSDPVGHRALFFSTHFDDAALAMRDGNRKYIYRFGRRPTEVYDLAADPREARDLAAAVPAAELLGAEADMRAWYSRVRNSYLVNRNE